MGHVHECTVLLRSILLMLALSRDLQLLDELVHALEELRARALEEPGWAEA